MPTSTDLAVQYLGVQETAGPNDGPILKIIREALLYPGAPPCSWCALFVTWILARSYLPLSTAPHDYKAGLRDILGFSSPWYCESTRDWFEQAMSARMIVATPEAGDLFILLNAEKTPHHIGFVTDFNGTLGEPFFRTIEGNTNAGGSVNGDGVYSRTRSTGPNVAYISLPAVLKA